MCLRKNKPGIWIWKMCWISGLHGLKIQMREFVVWIVSLFKSYIQNQDNNKAPVSRYQTNYLKPCYIFLIFKKYFKSLFMAIAFELCIYGLSLLQLLGFSSIIVSCSSAIAEVGAGSRHVAALLCILFVELFLHWYTPDRRNEFSAYLNLCNSQYLIMVPCKEG